MTLSSLIGVCLSVQFIHGDQCEFCYLSSSSFSSLPDTGLCDFSYRYCICSVGRGCVGVGVERREGETMAVSKLCTYECSCINDC